MGLPTQDLKEPFIICVIIDLLVFCIIRLSLCLRLLDHYKFDKLLGINKHKNKIKTCGEVYADSAYANKKNDEKLGKQNNKVLHRAYRNTPLTDRQKQENKQRSSIRYIVERTFGLLKQHHGLAKARYLGLERNKTRAQLIAMSHNLKTGMNIFKQMRSLGDCYAQ